MILSIAQKNGQPNNLYLVCSNSIAYKYTHTHTNNDDKSDLFSQIKRLSVTPFKSNFKVTIKMLYIRRGNNKVSNVRRED